MLEAVWLLDGVPVPVLLLEPVAVALDDGVAEAVGLTEGSHVVGSMGAMNTPRSATADVAGSLTSYSDVRSYTTVTLPVEGTKRNSLVEEVAYSTYDVTMLLGSSASWRPLSEYTGLKASSVMGVAAVHSEEVSEVRV